MKTQLMIFLLVVATVTSTFAQSQIRTTAAPTGTTGKVKPTVNKKARPNATKAKVATKTATKSSSTTTTTTTKTKTNPAKTDTVNAKGRNLTGGTGSTNPNNNGVTPGSPTIQTKGTPTPATPANPNININTKGGGGGNGGGGNNGGNKGGGNDNGGGIIPNLEDITNKEAADAIKAALNQGIAAAISKVAVENGYFGNSMIKIPFPQDAQSIQTALTDLGLGSMVDKVVLSLNRAAEGAANQAAPIFLNSITQMTLTDAINILGNQQPDAATQFLQRTTTEQLVTAFKPSVKTALDQTLATKYWSEAVNTYNQIPFMQKMNPDLTDFTTRKAVSGLFYMLAQEEAKIRKNPLGQTNSVIKKAFGAAAKAH